MLILIWNDLLFWFYRLKVIKLGFCFVILPNKLMSIFLHFIFAFFLPFGFFAILTLHLLLKSGDVVVELRVFFDDFESIL